MNKTCCVTISAIASAAAITAPFLVQAAPESPTSQRAMLAVLDVQLSALRSHKGVLRLCLTQDRQYFPDCAKDPAARHLNIAASDANDVRFNGLPYGRYALSLIHDENSNGRLDTRLGIPREGFGFSNNPAIFFGPPSFRASSFAIESATPRQMIKIKYMF